MDKQVKHEKIRFRRRDMQRLERLPSASTQAPLAAARTRRRSGFRRRLFGLAAVVVAIPLLAIAILLAVGASGLGTGRLQQAAQSALASFAGDDVSARFGDARLTLWGPGLVGIELRDAEFRSGGEDGHSAAVDRMRFGLRLVPLLSGELSLSGVNLSGVRIALGSGGDAAGALTMLSDERGLIDPDLVAAEAFSAIGKLLAASDRIGAPIAIDNLTLAWTEGADVADLTLDSIKIKPDTDGVSFDAAGHAASTPLTFAGSAGVDADAVVFELVAEAPEFRWSYSPGELAKPFARSINAAIGLRVTGRDDPQEGGGAVRTTLAIDGLVLETVDGYRQPGGYRIETLLEEGAGKLEIERFTADVGRSHLEFHGAVQPAPADEFPNPVYRYELVSDGSRIAASDSPERAIGALARIAGIVDPSHGRLTADELRVRTTGGEVFGNAALVFEEGKTPAAFLAITVPNMPVAHAKQLWPWKAADGARSWVLDNVYGGEVRNSRLEMSVVAGRFGESAPFRADEISGHFEVFGTRFDTAGEIPPVRDANGTIDFAGTDVVIRLSSGTAYLPSGRTVDAANGEFEIDALADPLIGALKIDVEGAADAVAELASFKPVEATRYVDLAPDDFTGAVSGHISGQIPLQEVTDPGVLTWHVALDYRGLAVAKPFGGQILTEADGSIVVDPESAVIRARGLLNGLPAEVALVEPLDGNDARRQSDIRLEIGDRAREKLLPSLNTILSGPVSVKIADGDNGGQLIDADLTRAAIHIPWAGWKKGAGIAASASFGMREDGGLTRLTGLKVRGDSFVVEGTVAMKGGEIETAEFSDVRLNRGDAFNMSVKRSGRGYQLTVTGDSIDARSLIRQFLADPDVTGEGFDGVPVSLAAKADKVRGFGNETVSGVDISYSGVGTNVSGLQITATTASGKPFAVAQRTDNGARKVEMQSTDAGAILRFLDIYGNMQGGSIDLRLTANGNGPLRGQIDARNFWIVNEPRLQALVTTAPQGDGRSLSQAVKRDIDVSKASFEQGFARIEKGAGYLAIDDGVLRGPLIGSTFQGRLYDADGNMSMTGTFMPAYGLNRLFADIPLVGLILGNGRDRGLIGITYKLSGDAKAPRLQVNPISVIAPGVFRQIFEFR
ncbi:MAG: DUF3971 domain-containing protein [Rhizobiaceae bacterium]